MRIIREHPLLSLVLGAGLLRIIAAFFARGYMATDDHQQVVEMAADWLRGNHVFLSGGETFYRSLLFPGFHWSIMALARAAGLVDPGAVMTLVRIILGLYSLWAVAVAWKFGLLLGESSGREGEGRRVAWTAGALVAAHAVMPWGAVRSLIETASIPPFLHSLYLLYLIDHPGPAGPAHAMGSTGWTGRIRAAFTTEPHPDRSTPRRDLGLAFGAGLLFGLAGLIRFQVLTAGAGIGLYLLWRRRPRVVTLWVLGAALPFLGQGLWDLALHGRFLDSVVVYIRYNRAHLYSYVNGPWYRFLLLTLGAFWPPFSLLFCAAMFRAVRRQGLLFWATAAFITAHSIVPGKQERFLLPVFPELALLGATGLADWTARAGPRFRRLVRIGWIWFWAINTPLLALTLVHYGQKARISPFLDIYRRGDARAVVMDLTEEAPLLPWYYLDGGQKGRMPAILELRQPEDYAAARRALGVDLRRSAGADSAKQVYVVIFTVGRIQDHLAELERELGPVRIIDHSSPDPIEWALRALNPRFNKSKESWLGVLNAGS